MANLGDLLSGAAGAPVNRPALDAYVTQGQAMAGLRTAQTEDALLSAQQARDKMGAYDNLAGSLQAAGWKPADAQAFTNYARATGRDPNELFEAHNTNQAGFYASVIADPNAPQPSRIAAMQALAKKFDVGQTQNVGNQLVNPVNPNGPAVVTQTPLSTAETNEHQAGANLKNAEAANPSAFHPSMWGQNGPAAHGLISPALQKAIDEGRFDPHTLNYRNAALFNQIAENNPTMDFNAAHTAGALAGNAPFQNRMVIFDTLPGILNHVTQLGKAINFNDARVVGNMQAWMKGQFNDPAYTEYMTTRNDALMKIASVMRGVGMSDQAHQAEIEAMNPTLSGPALDAWLRGQMSVLKPMLDRYHAAQHPNFTQPAPGAAPPAGGAGGPPAGNDPLGIR